MECSCDPKDRAAAERFGWPVGATEHWTPVEVFERSIAAAEALDADMVLAAFVAGLGSAPRGRQTLISYGWARFLSAAPKGENGLPDCDLGTLYGLNYYEVDFTEALLRLALGWSHNELPESQYLPDLEAAVAEGLPQPNDSDRLRLRALLDLIRAQPVGTRPSELEKAVARARIIPGTDKYQRYGILIGLSEFGVLPTPVLAPSWDKFVPVKERRAANRTVRGSSRSDITLPFGAWRGGIDEHKAQRLLDI
jgi:hypothetical protein